MSSLAQAVLIFGGLAFLFMLLCLGEEVWDHYFPLGDDE